MTQSSDSAAVGRKPLIAVDATPTPIKKATIGDKISIGVIAVMTLALGVIGFVNSFKNVAEAAEPAFGALAWTVPLGIDIGIAVFSILDIVLARLDMRMRFLRMIPWALTVATIYLNVAGETSLFGIVAHTVLPMLWVVAVEVGAHILRKRAGLASDARMDSIRKSRWLLAPFTTFMLWRRMVLWEIRSYPAALARERDRLLAKTELQDRYGRLWRWKATRRERALYKLGELVPVGTEAQVTPVEEQPEPEKKEQPKRKRTKRAAPDVSDLLPLGREIAKRFEEEGRRLTRDSLLAEIRNTDKGVSTARATELLRVLKKESGATRKKVSEKPKKAVAAVEVPGVA